MPRNVQQASATVLKTNPAFPMLCNVALRTRWHCAFLKTIVVKQCNVVHAFRLQPSCSTEHTNPGLSRRPQKRTLKATDQAGVRSGVSPRGRLQSSAHALRSGVCSGRIGPAVLPSSSSASSATPNPSVKLSANGRPPSPSHRYGVHFLWLGPGVLPSSPAYLQR